MAKKKENVNFATEIICMVKRKLWWYRIILAVSLVVNMAMAAVLIFR
ncbi:MAG: hypothetical protein HDQ96_01210 [Lachnospiraceae bacterium]|nr:hypothetical protein [Lachnospiraceae bacterium]